MGRYMFKFMKILAGFWYTFVVVVILIAALMGYLDEYTYVNWNKAHLAEKVGIPLLFITVIGFWTLMLEDFIENDDTGHRWLIGFILYFLNLIAILVYFWVVVYRRKKI